MPPAVAPDGQEPPLVAPLARRPSHAARPVLTVPLIHWAADSSDAEEGDDCWEAQCAGWRTGSANGGSGRTADGAALPCKGIDADDPTLQLALALGLDPLLLPAAGGPGLPGNPAAGIKALRFALAHPSSTPSLSASPAAGSNHHLAMTASVLAKQRRKAGEGAAAGCGSAEGGRDRVQQIDALLLAMKRRLRAVQAAMAADLAQAQEAEAQQQQQQQQPLDTIAEEAGSPRPAGEEQAVPAGEEEVEAVTGAAPVATGGQPILALSAKLTATSQGKHTAHNLLLSVLAGLPAEAERPASRSGAHSPSPATTSRSGAAQGSPRLKRPSVVAAELHAFADALRERQ
ncbi:hypothetical protein C2E21_2491 [Chlorella sorokiniana]|uniref:Uncharacterized protein n=1 Tax=Chlorella sorokiniana TaxID=3076 RepID=A0A2P6TZE8_CHLSO|nr:hypothetical protein C2E21_2491 [Chlorella sorokiniana]|eukprot:PRW59444.1 hypothetical protein C2E21_2491 [Chlorella sorokiniana]